MHSKIAPVPEESTVMGGRGGYGETSMLTRVASGAVNVSKIAILDRKSLIMDPGQSMLKGVTFIELHDPPAPPLNTWWQLLKGILIMKMSVLLLTVSGILVKYHYEYNPHVTIYDMVFVRAFSQLLMSYIIARRERVNLTDIPDHQWRLVIIRAITGTMTFFIFNTAVKLISLSKVAFLNNTSPIFATIIAFMFLGEAITRSEVASLSICIIGVAILVQPYGESSQEQTENTLGSILVLMSSFLNAVNYCLLRMMKEIHYCISPYYYGILGTLSSLPFIFNTEFQYVQLGLPSRLGSVDYLLFFLVGASSALGAISKSLAFQYEKVSTLSMLKYTNLFYSLAADVLLFQSHIYPGEIVGATLIVSSSFIIAVLKYYQLI
jgi:drug/metabolite transporter (DMT)-like permease